uniref:Uncharacterized protein n=1 Tax=Leptobrachium leishanense TaxID=445787 RepID=A0A8C5PF90_9ANUR
MAGPWCSGHAQAGIRSRFHTTVRCRNLHSRWTDGFWMLSILHSIGKIPTSGIHTHVFAKPSLAHYSHAPDESRTRPIKPAPSYRESAPSYRESAPSYRESAPSYRESAPSYRESAPSYRESAPSYRESAPSYRESALSS